MTSQIDYVGMRTGVVARRVIADAMQVVDMLSGYGYTVKLERHCGFWLVQWTFPRLVAPIRGVV